MKEIYSTTEDKSPELFYTVPESVKDGWFTLTGSEFHHARHVLRKRENDAVLVTDGMGIEYTAIIKQVMADRMRCEIRKVRRRPREPYSSVTLITGMIKSSRFSTLVEKTTEIGVNRIIPVMSEYVQVSENSRKSQRWRTIAKAAMKQSCRTVLPEIDQAVSFAEALECVEQVQIKLIAHPHPAARRLESILEDEKRKGLKVPVHTAAIAIGPEGGFSPDEVEMAVNKKFEIVSLGSRRLRSETAACVALTALFVYQDEY